MKEKLKIIIIGYYGKLNAGDDLLQLSMCQIFKDHDLMFTSWFPGIDIMNSVDLIVVGGGSIWPNYSFFQHGKELSKKLKTPLVVLGISAKNSDKKIQEETKYLLDIATYFHVRDSQSKEIIGDDRIIVGTDLYWWSKHHIPKADDIDMSAVSLNLRPWDGSEWDVNSLNNKINEHYKTVQPFPFYFGSARHESQASIQDYELSESLGYQNTPESFDISCLRHSSATIAMRFHALLVSIRAEIPIIGFDYHNKTKNLFSENSIPELCVPLNNTQALENAIVLLKSNYEYYKSLTIAIKDRNLVRAKHDQIIFLKTLSKIEPRSENKSQKIKRILKRYL
ncbi:polysaccharide pyruvyl transferase family protein [Neptunomonas japonica]|uniref:Polysaccharide pyruvyl transferase domain-containing protein n=1 Tax=Neptunomonas japonica JAMM 1380 TaxID=1441457 RepID=A0A7R6PGJ9_9GAMM|nr:polysaccharide pyruvyl transferase family protein [Neptunomonas japonica]BBB28761.1 hypothetical protein NEJAP_0804 [Neptunomonas japonica JAMM 1380]